MGIKCIVKRFLAAVCVLSAFSCGGNDGNVVMAQGTGNNGTVNMKVRVSDGANTIVFELNGTSAARSFYAMLPFETSVSNYNNNEKVFDPPVNISYSDDCIEGDCPVGTMALFSPWGNVAMYYGPASRYKGLYLMGKAVEGVDNIKKLSGTIRLEKQDEANSVNKPKVDAKASKAYTVSGTPAQSDSNGIVIKDGKKTVKM